MLAEGINLLYRAIRPFGLNAPLLAITPYYEENWLSRNFGHSDSIGAISGAYKAATPRAIGRNFL
jgi:hypothetical protein